jgi:hypothetical protein
VIDEIDHDGDKIDDTIAAAPPDSVVEVTVVLARPVEQRHVDAFIAGGGAVHHRFRILSYGWTGAIKASAVSAFATAIGADLHAVVLAQPAVLFLDEATRTGRVRAAWASGFAGFTSGFSGSSSTTIGIIDGTHTDLAGRMAGWKDYTPDDHTSPTDARGTART